jgi:hypothetical protein
MGLSAAMFLSPKGLRKNTAQNTDKNVGVFICVSVKKLNLI